MTQNVNLSPLFNSLKVQNTRGDYFHLNSNGFLKSNLSNIRISSNGFCNLSSTLDLKLNTNSTNGSIFLNSLKNTIIKSNNNIDISGKNIVLTSQTEDLNNISLISDNINSNSTTTNLTSTNYNNTVNSTYTLSSSNINIIGSNDICIAAYSSSLDITNTPRIDIGTHSGMKLINDNIIFGEEDIGTHSINYDKKFNLTLTKNDNNQSKYNGMYISNYNDTNKTSILSLEDNYIEISGNINTIPYTNGDNIKLSNSNSTSIINIISSIEESVYENRVRIGLSSSIDINENFNTLEMNTQEGPFPEMSITNYNVYGTPSTIFEKDKLSLGINNTETFIDVDSPSDFIIKKNNSQILGINSITGISIGSKTNTYSTLDVVQKEESIISLTTTIKDNFQAVNIDNYLITTYLDPNYNDGILTSYNIVLKGASLFDTKIDSFISIIDTYNNISNQELFQLLQLNNYLNLKHFIPKIGFIKYTDFYIICVLWNTLDTNDTGKYNIKSKFIKFNINTLSREILNPTNTDLSLIIDNDSIFINGTQLSNSPIDFDILGHDGKVQLYIPENYVDYNFIISWKFKDDSNNEYIKTSLINYTEISNVANLSMTTSSITTSGVNNIQLLKLTIKYNNVYFLLSYTKDQIVEVSSNIDTNPRDIFYAYCYYDLNNLVNTETISLIMGTPNIVNYIYNNIIHNNMSTCYTVNSYNICAESKNSSNILVSWYNQYCPNLKSVLFNSVSSQITLKKKSDSSKEIPLDGFDSIDNPRGVISIYNTYITSDGSNPLIEIGDLVYSTNYPLFFQKIENIENITINGSNKFKITLSNNIKNIYAVVINSIINDTESEALSGNARVSVTSTISYLSTINNTLLNLTPSDKFSISSGILDIDSSTKNILNIERDYYVISWIDKIDDYYTFKYSLFNKNSNIKEDEKKIILNTASSQYNIFRFINKNLTYNNNNINIYLFTHSQNETLKFTYLRNPEIPILRVSKGSLNNFSISNKNITYSTINPKFNLIDSSTTEDKNMEFNFKYGIDTETDNIAKFRAQRVSNNNSLSLIVANSEGVYNDLVGVSFLNNGLGSIKFNGDKMKSGAIVLNSDTDIQLSTSSSPIIITDTTIQTSSILLEDNTNYLDVSDFTKLIKFFREGDKLIDGQGNIFGIDTINTNSFQLSPYSINENLTSNTYNLLPSILYCFDNNNNNIMVVDYYGNLGLGTKNPRSKIDIKPINQDDSSYIQFTTNTQNINSGIKFAKENLNNLNVSDNLRINHENFNNTLNIDIYDSSNQTINWINKFKINRTGVIIGENLNNIIPSSSLQVIGDNIGAYNPNIKMTNIHFSNSSSIDYNFYENRLSFGYGIFDTTFNDYQFSRISGKLDKNIEDISSTSIYGAIELSTRNNNSEDDGSLLYISSTKHIGINTDNPKTGLHINSSFPTNTSIDMDLRTSYGDLNINNTNNTSSLSFSYGNDSINSKIESKSAVESSTSVIRTGLYFKFFDPDTANTIQKVKRSLYINNYSNMLIGNTSFDPESNLHEGTNTINTLSITTGGGGGVGNPTRGTRFCSHIYTTTSTVTRNNNNLATDLDIYYTKLLPSTSANEPFRESYIIPGMRVDPIGADGKELRVNRDPTDNKLKFSLDYHQTPPEGYMYLSSINTNTASNISISNINPELKINCGIKTISSVPEQLWYNILLYDNIGDNNLFPTSYSQNTPDKFMIKIKKSEAKMGINFEESDTNVPQSTLDVNGSIGVKTKIYSGSEGIQTIQDDTVIHIVEPPSSGVEIILKESYSVAGRILTFKRKGSNIRTSSAYQIFLRLNADDTSQIQLNDDNGDGLEPIDSSNVVFDDRGIEILKKKYDVLRLFCDVDTSVSPHTKIYYVI